MKSFKKWAGIIIVYCSILFIFFLAVYFINKTVTTISKNMPIQDRMCVIIDAGHGGIDGGAVSCTGVYESHINLQIALRLDDLLHLLGIKTKMIRTTDVSIYTSGETIAGKKASDLRERVRIVNETENGILLSIHQNYYSDSRYSGAQMFYAESDSSKELALMLQKEFRQSLDPANDRQIKKASGVYLMAHTERPSVLVECGFISNPEEEARLTSDAYQKKLCCVLAAVCTRYLYSAGPLA